MTTNCPPAPYPEMITPDSSEPTTVPTCILTELSDIPVQRESRPHDVVGERLPRGHLERGHASACRDESENVPQARHVGNQRGSYDERYQHSAQRDRDEQCAPSTTRSATAPDTSPSAKNGSIVSADDSPTMNAESVISNTSQPVTTQIIPIDADCSSVETHSSRKSRKANEGASLEMVQGISLSF